MDGSIWIDELYAVFCSALPADLREPASRLQCTLGLAPTKDVPWSQVFGHEITLAAPAMFAEAMPNVPTRKVMDAVLAHALAVIEAFGTDRIEDRQVEPSRELTDVLRHARVVRDQALGRLAPGVSDPAIEGPRADAETLAAIGVERAMLSSGSGVTMGEYEAASVGKQRVGFPATLALAHAAGFCRRRRGAVSRTLEDVWIGLQLHDDVVDWEDDLDRGGAWAFALARGLAERPPPSARKTMPPMARRMVHESGVLAMMLSRSRHRFRAARLRARALGAHRLAAWAGERELYVHGLWMNEAKSAGFTNRAHALSAWAREILG